MADSIGTTIGKTIGSGMQKVSNATGLSALDETISSFTKKNTFTSLINDIFGGTNIVSVNNTKVGVSKGQSLGLANKFQEGLNKFDKTIKLDKWATPTTLALNSFDQIGKEIDKALEDSFLLQAFHVKGTEVLCASFCFLLSTLPCSVRNDIHKTLQNINKATQAVESGARAANEIISAVGAITSTVDKITDVTSELFTKDNSAITANLRAASKIAAAPLAILKNLGIIANALKLGLNFKFMMPDMEGRSLWDLSQNVLLLVQSQAVQMADEALGKLIQPIEDMLKGITPSICYGTMAMRIQNAIMSTIETFKSRLLKELAQLFVSNNDFNLKFKEYGIKSSFALEIHAFSVALDYISANFYNIARACGVAPCGPGSVPRADLFNRDDIGNLEDGFYNKTGTYPTVYNADPIIANNLEDLAEKMEPHLGIGYDLYVTPNEVISIYDLNEEDAPKKIIDMINNGVLNNILDNNYEIYSTPKNIKVLYRYKKKCGSEE